MYKNLIQAMDSENITFSQIAELLKCQLRTVSEKAKGNIESGFSVDEAITIKKVFFPSYDFFHLFERCKSKNIV